MIRYINYKTLEIEGSFYQENLVVEYTGRIFSWEKDHPNIKKQDIDLFLNKNPEIVVIGKSDAIQVADEITKENTLFVIDDLKEAVKCFNKAINMGKRVVGVFDLES